MDGQDSVQLALTGSVIASFQTIIGFILCGLSADCFSVVFLFVVVQKSHFSGGIVKACICYLGTICNNVVIVCNK